MKKINKSLPPNPLTEFAKTNQTADWTTFYNTEHYNVIKQLVFQEQASLCAFCETKIVEFHKQRLEHFHPKSDKTNPNHNWALDWQNIIGVCLGGSDVDKTKHPLPANLSCDAYKDYLIQKHKLPEICEGYLLNPLNIPAFPCLFDFDKRTGELKPKDDYEGVKFQNNQYGSTAELVAKTIEHLNLNCDRLNQQRLEVLKLYNQEIAKARKSNDKTIFTKLAQRWFQNAWPSFFSTRWILLGNHAESFLQQQAYNG